MRAHNIELMHELNATNPIVLCHLARVYADILQDQDFLNEVASIFESKGESFRNGSENQPAPTNYSTRAVCASYPDLSPEPLSYRF